MKVHTTALVRIVQNKKRVQMFISKRKGNTLCCIFVVESYSAIKVNEPLIFSTTQMRLRILRLREKSQSPLRSTNYLYKIQNTS